MNHEPQHLINTGCSCQSRIRFHSIDIFCNLNGGLVVPWQHYHGMRMNLCFFGYTLVRSSMMLQYVVPNLLQRNTIPFHDIEL